MVLHGFGSTGRRRYKKFTNNNNKTRQTHTTQEEKKKNKKMSTQQIGFSKVKAADYKQPTTKKHKNAHTIYKSVFFGELRKQKKE